MKLKDSRGLPVSTESDTALESYERAALETHGYFGNPLASLDAALAAPEWCRVIHFEHVHVGLQQRRVMMFSKLVYRGLPVSVLLVAAAVMQGFAVQAFALEAVQVEVVSGVEPTRHDCRPVERLGGKVKIRKTPCRGQS